MFELYMPSAVVTVAVSGLLFALALMTGVARVKGKVKSYETYSTQDKKFIIATRVHQNTLENAVVFLPLLWVATVYSDFPNLAAAVGLGWVLARIFYAYAYYQDPSKRFYGFMLSLVCLAVMLGLSLYGFYLEF